MEKNKSVAIIVILIIAFFLLTQKPLGIFPKGTFSVLTPPVAFAGFNFEDSGTLLSGDCNSGGGQSSVSVSENSPLILSSSGGSKNIQRTLKTDVTGVDELLILYEGSASCQPKQSGGGFSAEFTGSGGGRLSFSKSIGCSDFDSPKNTVFPRSIIKIKNNFDGTWSMSEALTLGDLDFVNPNQRNTISGERQYLTFESDTGSSCALGGTSSSQFIIYNIIRKQNGFAQCKADQYVSGFNNNQPICTNISYLKLNFEESLYQSLQSYIDSHKALLEQKDKYFNTTIEDLKQELLVSNQALQILLQNQINNLTLQSQETKRVLDLVNKRDPSVIKIFTQSDALPASTVTTTVPETPSPSFFASIPFPLKVIGAILAIFLFSRLL